MFCDILTVKTLKRIRSIRGSALVHTCITHLKATGVNDNRFQFIFKTYTSQIEKYV